MLENSRIFRFRVKRNESECYSNLFNKLISRQKKEEKKKKKKKKKRKK
jgi:hypothetical protein